MVEASGADRVNGGALGGPVDVVIVIHDNERHLAAAVASARRWPRVARLVVVDNGSADGGAALAAKIADVVIAQPDNPGFGAGVNAGVRASSTDSLLVLNPDAVVEADALEVGWQVMAGNSKVALVQGVIRRAADGQVERSQGGPPGLADLVARRTGARRLIGERGLRMAARVVGRGDFAERQPEARTDVAFLAAVAPLVRRSAFDEVGGFDPGYFLYAEDADLCLRLRASGWSLWTMPEVWATHVGGASSAGRDAWRQEQWWRAHRRLVAQHWVGARRSVGMALVPRAYR